MEGFKNTTRMKTFGDEAPQAYAKGGSVKPMAKAAPKKADAKYPVKRNDGNLANMTPAERRASMEETSRAMTPAQTRALQATMAAKAAAPKKGPLIKPAREMTPAERRMNQMDRPTNNMGAEAHKGGGKVGGSKVPFAVKKVMRKAEGGEVSAPPPIPEMPTGYAPPPPPVAYDQYQEPTPQSVFGNLPSPDLPTPKSVFGDNSNYSDYSIYPDPSTTAGMMPVQNADGTWRAVPARGTSPGPSQRQFSDYVFTPENSPEMFAADRARVAAAQAAQADRAATMQAQQEMAAQAQMDRGLGLDLGGRRNSQDPMYNRGGRIIGPRY